MTQNEIERLRKEWEEARKAAAEEAARAQRVAQELALAEQRERQRRR